VLCLLNIPTFKISPQKCAIFSSYLTFCSTAFLMTDFDNPAMSRLLWKINMLRSRNAGPFWERRLRIQEIKMPFKTPHRPLAFLLPRQINLAEFIGCSHLFHSFCRPLLLCHFRFPLKFQVFLGLLKKKAVAQII